MTKRSERNSMSITDPPSQTRREIMAAMAVAGGAAAFGMVGYAAAETRRNMTASDPQIARHAHDWEWLVGSWDVWHRRLKERLAGSNEWDEFAGKSVMWLTMGGLGTIDDNSLDLPGGVYRGLGIRAFDPATRQWSIWWLDARNPASIDPPVVGRFDGDTGTFFGRHIHDGRPVTARFRWQEIHGSRPHWEQAFSTDGGATWEVNWVNFFTRTSATPIPLPRTEGAALREQHDWDFLVGKWQVRNRRLKQRLAGSTQWEEFNSTLVNWPVLGGWGNVGDNVFDPAAGSYRGVSVRAFDAEKRQWLSWWLDGRSPATITPPVRGGFTNGVGTFIGDDVFNGRPIQVRSRWSQITPASARWEQASSGDDGVSWETNWTSDFARIT
jgi:hypothetical protein